MVLLNYEKYIEERLREEARKATDEKMARICLDIDFKSLMVKLYEYCEEINIIEQRMDVLAKETQKIKNLKPQLLDSQIIKIQQKTKQISTAYSIFLFKQEKIKVSSYESIFYENIIRLIETILQKCFSKDDFSRLKKEVNRLIRTNTFNRKICWDEFSKKVNNDPLLSKKKKDQGRSNFRGFRRTVFNQSSEIRPYVNNRSCFKTRQTRSPIISLMFPTSQYLSFKLSRRNMKSLKK